MSSGKIPKVLHQTYKSFDAIPIAIKSIIDELRNKNPDWEYKFYDDADCYKFIKKNYDENILNLYLSIHTNLAAAKADLFRYLLIYKEGGVYLDIKSTCLKPLSEVINDDDEILLSYWPSAKGGHLQLSHLTESEIPQWYIAAMPGSPFIRAVIDKALNNLKNYTPWLYGIGKLGVLRTTGPVAYTIAIHPLLKKHPNTFKASPEEHGFLYSGFEKTDTHEIILKYHYSKYDCSVLKIDNISKHISFISFYLCTIPTKTYRAFKRLLPKRLKARLKKHKIFWYL